MYPLCNFWMELLFFVCVCVFFFQALEQLHEMGAKQSVSVLQLWMAAL